MSTIKAIKRGVAAALKRPAQKYKASAKLIITCSQCGGDQFHPFSLTTFATEGLREHYSLECAACSHLEMFAKQPVEFEP